MTAIGCETYAKNNNDLVSSNLVKAMLEKDRKYIEIEIEKMAK
jgi:hypothetical protein